MVYYQRRQNKYKAKTTEYNGRRYHSKKEASYAWELDMLKKAGEVESWEPQFKVSLDIPDPVTGKKRHICNYYIDFKVNYTNGNIELVEVKGFETETWRLKRKLLEAVYLPVHPEYTYVVVK